jgi:uncharacterized protein YbjQ (UPF0145 family)
VAPIWIQLIIAAVFLGLGYFVGKWREMAHFRKLAEREGELSWLLVTDLRTVPADAQREACSLVTGGAVIATDYFKSFVGRLRNMVGGEVRVFETMMERARRQALVRVLEEAEALGANRVINVRFETSSIGAMQKKQGAAMVEVLAYGTAVFVPPAA